MGRERGRAEDKDEEAELREKGRRKDKENKDEVSNKPFGSDYQIYSTSFFTHNMQGKITLINF